LTHPLCGLRHLCAVALRQGRYKSILIGEGRSLLGLVDYIHLNPVRASLCEVNSLKDYALSSYPKYFKRTPQDSLCREDFLGMLELPESLAGMRRYASHLELCEAQDPKLREALTKRYCRGWFIGSKESKKALSKDLNEKHPDIVWDGADLKELKEAQWEAVATRELKRHRIDESEIPSAAKGVEWKVQIAKALRTETTASNTWIAQRLNMGHPSRITNILRNNP